MGADSPFSSMQAERSQDHRTRVPLYKRLTTLLGRPVVALFTSNLYPVMLTDSDANMLEMVLQEIDLSTGLCLVISSPGGSGVAAERIVNMCRAYSGTGEYWAYVPSKAKSAATMVCMGASKIVMGPSSELGPIDPQWGPTDNGVVLSLANVVRTYDELFQAAVDTDGHIEPYLQQLANYDEREIAEFRSACLLADDIAVRALRTGMMSGAADDGIRAKIDVFCSPERTMSHGRPIYHAEAAECGLSIELADVKSKGWKAAYELQVRLDAYVSTQASKAIEYVGDGYVAGAPGPAEE
jgi:Serine dehydrogenase proteinase